MLVQSCNENMCRKCNKRVDKKTEDFNLTMYIEVEKQDVLQDDEDILDVFSFKSTLGLQNIEEMEITVEKLNTLMTGNRCDIQYNIDNRNEDCFWLISSYPPLHMRSMKVHVACERSSF